MDGNPWAAISVGLAVLGWLVTVVASYARQQKHQEGLVTKEELAQKLKDERKETMQDVRQLLYDLRLID